MSGSISFGANVRCSLSIAACITSFASPPLHLADSSRKPEAHIPSSHIEKRRGVKNPCANSGFLVLSSCTRTVFEPFPSLRTRWIILPSFVIFCPDFNPVINSG